MTNTTCNIHTAGRRCGRPVVKDIAENNGCSCRGCREFGGVCDLHLAWMESRISTEELLMGLLASVHAEDSE